MSSRSKRQRRSKKFDDFAYEEEDEFETQIDGLSDWPASPTRPSRAAPLLHNIKKEPDDTCVLPTDSVIDIAVRTRKKSSCTKAQLKSMINQDEIPFDLLLTFSSVMLRELFSVLESDELSRQFVIKCQLMPTRCAITCRSFGNERRAQAAMERHLMDHVNQLTQESASDFVAESVQARERRFKRETLKTKIKMESPKVVLERLPLFDEPPPSRKRRGRKKQVSVRDPLTPLPLTAAKVEQRRAKKKLKISYGNGARKNTARVKEEMRNEKGESSASEIEIEDFDDSSPSLGDASSRSTMLLETETMISKQKEMIERVRSQLRLEKQPYKDHCYPVLVKGQFRNDLLPEEVEETTMVPPNVYSINNKSEWCQSSDSEGEDIIEHDLACHYSSTGAKRRTGYVVAKGNTQVPIMQLLQIPKRSATAPAVGEEVVISKCKPKVLNPSPPASSGCIVESDSDDDGPSITTLARPYPPMPKYMPELGTKLIIPEEEMSFEDNEEVPEQWDLKNPDHVKRYAVRCMRDLRVNKGLGARNCNVSCKICNKEFTATATLMYHYRSHAEIKPFCCLLCKATFTRQHSLNYHMLIHNDANRFKCPDCGRAFRHPSHYKEHRRKHTGEQPYHCPECRMKFKTRNSYKRHLNGKHPTLDVKEIDKAKKARRLVEQKQAMEEANQHNGLQRKFLIPPAGLRSRPKLPVAITAAHTSFARSASVFALSTSTATSSISMKTAAKTQLTATSLIGSNTRPVLVVRSPASNDKGASGGDSVGLKPGMQLKLITNATCQSAVSSVVTTSKMSISKVIQPNISLPGVTTLNSSPRVSASVPRGAGIPLGPGRITVVQANGTVSGSLPMGTSSALAFLQRPGGVRAPLGIKPQLIVLARQTPVQTLSFPKLVTPVISQGTPPGAMNKNVVSSSKQKGSTATGQAMSTAAGQAVSTATGQALSTATGQALSTATGQAMSTATGQAVSTAAGQAVSTATGQAVSTAAGQAVSTATGQAVSTATGQAVSTANGQAVSTAAGQAVSTATGQAVSTATGQAVSTATGQAVSTATGQAVSAATGQLVFTATGQAVSTATGQLVSTATGQAVSTATGQAVSTATGQAVSTATGPVVSAAAVNCGQSSTAVAMTPLMCVTKQPASRPTANNPSTVLDTDDDDNDTSLLCLDATLSD